jgi:hypothetical protein
VNYRGSSRPNETTLLFVASNPAPKHGSVTATMSKLHVKQIEGYLSRTAKTAVNMNDYARHTDQEQIRKAFLTRALAALSVSHLAEVSLQELGPHVTDGSRDGGIDLIYFDSKERTLYLVQTKWHDDGRGSVQLGDALKFIAGVRKVLDNDLEALNDRIKARKADIERALFDANAKFVLVLAHTGQEALSTEVAAAIGEYIDAQNDTSELMSLRTLSQSDLHKAVAAGVAGAPISLEVQLTGWGQVREPHFAIYGQVCAGDVASWFETHGNRLFTRNLRQFIVSSIVNQDIVATLIQRPSDFWYFNNGITAIASSVAKKPIGGNATDSGIFECTAFSVVNGAQTVGSIHAAAKQDVQAVNKAMVSVRIISIADGSPAFGLEVTRNTNTQNAVEKRDFVALDPTQERIRQELQFEGVEYAYKTGTASVSASRGFDLLEATVALASAHEEVAMAVQAKREIGRLWEDISKAPYTQLFNAGVNGPQIWETVQTLRAIDAALQSEAKHYSGRDALVCIHGNRFIQWSTFKTLALQPNFTFVGIEKTIPDAVERTVERVVGAVKTRFADSYPASLFKNLSKCRALAS